MPLSIGTILGSRYRFDALLGQGGMGAVYRAWDSRIDQPVAIKENRMASPASVRQFVREAKIMAGLRHPNLPRVTDHFALPDGVQYLVMEFIEGEDLGHILQRTGPLDETRALAWIDQVCDALVYLHSQDPPIIHRDIKPDNIKITPQGAVFLVDFGIAKMGNAKERTNTGAVGVTPGFSPLEQYGSGGTDARSDIYSLGATVYALLTGHAPPDSVQRSSDEEQLVPPRQLRPDLSPALASAISAALESRRTDRPQTVDDFRALIRPGVGKAPIPAVPAAARRRAPLWAWVPGAAATLLLCGLIVAALSGVCGALLGTRPASPGALSSTPVDPVPLATSEPTPEPTKEPTEEPPEPTSTPLPLDSELGNVAIGTNAEYPPFEFVGDDGNLAGFDIDLMDAIAEEASFEFEFVNTRWDGIFVALASGEFDAVISAATITEERKQTVDFSDPYFNAGQMIFVRADTADISGPDDLDGKSTGVQLGTTGDIWLSEETGAEVVRYDENTLAFQALANGDVDAAVADGPTGIDIVQANPDMNLKALDGTYTDEEYGVAVRKDRQDVLEAINRGLAAVRASGQYDELYDKYFGIE